MISLRNAKLTDALPQIIAKEPWAQALAYAVNIQIGRLLDYANGVMVSANVDAMPDAVLDILAVELRIPYYNRDYATPVKRELIKGAIQYWATAGTVGSLTKILEDIFGDAEIEDWYTYNSSPGYFRILTNNPNVTGDTLKQFEETAKNVKRLSAWLDYVIVDIGIPAMNLYQGCAIHTDTDIILTQEG